MVRATICHWPPVAPLWRVSAQVICQGVHLADHLIFNTNTTAIVKKPPRPAPQHLLQRHCGTYVLTSQFGNWKAEEKHWLSRIVKSASNIIGSLLPSLEGIFNHRCALRAISIIRDCHHPSYNLFSLLPSEKKYRSLHTKSARMLQFFPHTVRIINRLCPLHLPCFPPTKHKYVQC